MSNAKTLIMYAMGSKLKQVRSDLTNGYHNPILMEEIGHLNDVIELVISFEHRLLSELDDID